MNDDLVIYTSTSKSKVPNDDLVESECARFKASGADFGIIELPEIKRWMVVTPILQFSIHDNLEAVDGLKNEYAIKKNECVFATFKQNTEIAPSAPEEIISLIGEVKKQIPDKFPGRLPTISILDPDGGFWTTSQARTVSSLKPIFCPTVRFDINPPELYYDLEENAILNAHPSIDAAFHAYLFAGLECVNTIMTIPIRPNKKEEISMITDGNLFLNDLNVADFILEQILNGEVWKDKDQPCVIAFGTANTLILSKDSEQLQNLLLNNFFFRYEQ